MTNETIIASIENSSVYDVAIHTPIQALPVISSQIENKVFLKREDLQPVHSFKIRGAYHKISQLTEEQKKAGIIAASAGNHAQGVALSARHSHIKACIVMPTTTPQIKVDSVKRFGATVILHGDTYNDAYEHALEQADVHGYTFIHPYDDDEVIAGQGTVAKELLEQLNEPMDYIFIPVGGGGLFAGMAAYIKQKHPSVKIIAVEHEQSACFYAAAQAKERVILPHIDIFADGVAVNQIGERPFAIAKSLVDDHVLVSTDEICAATKDIFDNIRAISEPAGALSLAGIKKYCHDHSLHSKVVVGLLSGANVNFHRLRHISERAAIGEKNEALFAVEIPEEKGSFLSFLHHLKGRSITEFNYRYSDDSIAHIFVGVELTGDTDDRDRIFESLSGSDYNVKDLSDNDVAKIHIRYMVGGKAPSISDEHLFRFQFPERPGALLHFLSHIGSHWNITLFHYRNHGSAFGRVLVGLQGEDKKALTAFLDTIGYHYFDEGDNDAYRIFL